MFYTCSLNCGWFSIRENGPTSNLGKRRYTLVWPHWRERKKPLTIKTDGQFTWWRVQRRKEIKSVWVMRLFCFSNYHTSSPHVLLYLNTFFIYIFFSGGFVSATSGQSLGLRQLILVEGLSSMSFTPKLFANRTYFWNLAVLWGLFNDKKKSTWNAVDLKVMTNFFFLKKKLITHENRGAIITSWIHSFTGQQMCTFDFISLTKAKVTHV